jgi:poly-beta-1,6-N-acetyl-D-glucosamine synthase
VVQEGPDREATQGETAYWSYEARLKTWESLAGSIVTADGEIFAMRRALYDFPPSNVVHDDMYLTVSLVQRGFRVIYEPDATSVEHASRNLVDEFHLKVRYASAGYQIVSRFKGFVLVPTHWFAIEFISHKLLRWLAPVFLLLALAASAAIGQPLYTALFAAGVGVLAAAAAAWPFRSAKLSAPLYFPLYFVVMNVAVLYGLGRYVSIGQTTHWRKASR